MIGNEFESRKAVAAARRFAPFVPKMPEDGIDSGFRWAGCEQGDADRPSSWGKRTGLRSSVRMDVGETEFRQTVYMAAVCRCFPGKNSLGGDRVPSREEVARCGDWLRAEITILGPGLVIPVGKLAIAQFLAVVPMLTELVGQIIRVQRFGQEFDLVPLPHPSGASPWHRIEPGKTLTKKALALIKSHPAWIARV
jgi:uracil-DNA glycosylase